METILTPTLKMEKKISLERLRDLAKFTQLVNGGVRAQMQAAWFQAWRLITFPILLLDAKKLLENILFLYLSICLFMTL